jgi:hypothetical protein
MRAELQQDKQRAPGVPFKPGMNSRKLRQLKVEAKLNRLITEYFPNGISGIGYMDMNRLRLAASHRIDADLCRDPVIRQRATRCAEYLLSKLKPPAVFRSPAADQAAQALELLLNKPSEDGV